MIRSPLCFIHLPKTGGTTLTSFLDDHYCVDEILKADFNYEIQRLSEMELNSAKLLRGHFKYGDLKDRLPKNTHYITMLRNPISRIVSSHQHWLRERYQDRVQGVIMNEERALHRQWSLERGDPLDTVKNRCCRDLSGIKSEDAGNVDIAIHLEMARENLKNYFFVGLTERFDESIELLCRKMGWLVPQCVRRLNTSTKSSLDAVSDFPQKVIDGIKERNWADIELYNFAKELFADRIREIQHFKMENFDLYLQAYNSRNPNLFNEIHFTFDQALEGDGWHQREGTDGGLPQIIRWTGPQKESFLDFPLARERDCSIQIRVVNAMSGDILNSLEVLVNDNLLPLGKSKDSGWGIIFSGKIQKEWLRPESPFTRVQFRVKHTKMLSDVNPAVADHRQCGVAISEVLFSDVMNQRVMNSRSGRLLKWLLSKYHNYRPQTL